MIRLRVALLIALAAAACASSHPRDDTPIPVRTVELPPEVEGTDPHRPGGPFDLAPDRPWAGFPDGGAQAKPASRELPGYMESAPAAGTGGPLSNPWTL